MWLGAVLRSNDGIAHAHVTRTATWTHMGGLTEVVEHTVGAKGQQQDATNQGCQTCAEEDSSSTHSVSALAMPQKQVDEL